LSSSCFSPAWIRQEVISWHLFFSWLVAPPGGATILVGVTFSFLMPHLQALFQSSFSSGLRRVSALWVEFQETPPGQGFLSSPALIADPPSFLSRAWEHFLVKTISSAPAPPPPPLPPPGSFFLSQPKGFPPPSKMPAITKWLSYMLLSAPWVFPFLPPEFSFF